MSWSQNKNGMIEEGVEMWPILQLKSLQSDFEQKLLLLKRRAFGCTNMSGLVSIYFALFPKTAFLCLFAYTLMHCLCVQSI